MLTTMVEALVTSRTFRRAFMGFILLVVWLIPLAAAAHEEVIVGSYKFEIGWLNEPVLVGQPNSLYLFITAAGESEHAVDTSQADHAEETDEHDHVEEMSDDSQTTEITGAEATLNFAVEYGSIRQTYTLRPVVGRPGQYAADFIPTREGQYTFLFSGTLNGEAIELKFEPEEVETAGKLAFPEPLPSSAELTTRLAVVQAQASTAQILAIVGVVFGLIGTGFGVYSLVKNRGQ